MDSYKYVINLRTKEYIEIPEYDESKWTVHPLPLLLAESNGRGGGDYSGINMELIGTWAWDEIEITSKSPRGKGMKLIDVTFNETF